MWCYCSCLCCGRFNCCSDDGFVSVVIVCDVVLVSFILVATVNVSCVVCATVVIVATVDAADVWLILVKSTDVSKNVGGITVVCTDA